MTLHSASASLVLAAAQRSADSIPRLRASTIQRYCIRNTPAPWASRHTKRCSSTKEHCGFSDASLEPVLTAAASAAQKSAHACPCAPPGAMAEHLHQGCHRERHARRRCSAICISMACLRPLECLPVCLDDAVAISQRKRVRQATHRALPAMPGLRLSVQMTLALLPVFLLMRRVWCVHLLLLPCLLPC